LQAEAEPSLSSFAVASSATAAEDGFEGDSDRVAGAAAKKRAPKSELRIHDEPSFVLHGYPYKETSLVVEVLTRHYGRVALVARGAKRPRSALRGVLQAFQPLALGWIGARSKTFELKKLTRAEWVGGVAPLRGEGLLCGFYLNELLLKLLARDDAHEALYETYHATLVTLSNGGEHATTLRTFERRLLREAGYALTLDRDALTGEPISADYSYRYLLERGPVRVKAEAFHVAERGDDDENRLELAGQTLLDMAQDDYTRPATLQQSKALMRILINHCLGNQILNTRQLLKDMQQL
jgi:DNA repair protein RecO (recombination protein O)